MDQPLGPDRAVDHAKVRAQIRHEVARIVGGLVPDLAERTTTVSDIRGRVVIELDYELIPENYPTDEISQWPGYDQRSYDDGNIDLERLVQMGKVKKVIFGLPEEFDA